jgi:hypothetical protein
MFPKELCRSKSKSSFWYLKHVLCADTSKATMTPNHTTSIRVVHLKTIRSKQPNYCYLVCGKIVVNFHCCWTRLRAVIDELAIKDIPRSMVVF